MSADLVIRGGTVVDGTGAPGFAADVAVTDGVISEIGSGLSGDRVLDADGHERSPPASSTSTRTTTPRCSGTPPSRRRSFHGVTTVIAGNCGFSIAP